MFLLSIFQYQREREYLELSEVTYPLRQRIGCLLCCLITEKFKPCVYFPRIETSHNTTHFCRCERNHHTLYKLVTSSFEMCYFKFDFLRTILRSQRSQGNGMHLICFPIVKWTKEHRIKKNNSTITNRDNEFVIVLKGWGHDHDTYMENVCVLELDGLDSSSFLVLRPNLSVIW